MEQGCAELLLILSALYILMWRETSSHHLCFLREKTRSGEACTGTMRRFTPNIAQYLGTDTNNWACNMPSKRMKREANGFCVCPLPVHCKDFHNQNIPEWLIAIFDRISVSIPATAVAWDGPSGVTKQPTSISIICQITNLQKRYLYSFLQDERHT